MNRLKKYETLGFFIIAILTLSIAVLYSNIGGNVPPDQMLSLSNISLFAMGLHMFLAVLIFGLFEFIALGHEYRNFFFAKAACCLVAPFAFVFITYFLTTLMKNSTFAIFSLSFVMAIFLGQYLSYFFLRERYYFRLMNIYGIISIIVIFLVFFVYSNNHLLSSPIFEPLSKYNQIIKRTY